MTVDRREPHLQVFAQLEGVVLVLKEGQGKDITLAWGDSLAVAFADGYVFEVSAVAPGEELMSAKKLAWQQEVKKALAYYLERRSALCNVCTGQSPTWDGHDRNPACGMGALEMLKEVVDSW